MPARAGLQRRWPLHHNRISLHLDVLAVWARLGVVRAVCDKETQCKSRYRMSFRRVCLFVPSKSWHKSSFLTRRKIEKNKKSDRVFRSHLGGSIVQPISVGPPETLKKDSGDSLHETVVSFQLFERAVFRPEPVLANGVDLISRTKPEKEKRQRTPFRFAHLRLPSTIWTLSPAPEY